ncbi:MAG: aminotransferase class IV, partial [Pseudomonadota bacterium]|nr:aminotransferase class IV [Pseudomonadota bacterium]
MALSNTIRTYYKGTWHQGDLPVMNAADHGAWLGSTVFDGARFVNGLTPDLDKHCARTNRSAKALMLNPTVSAEEMEQIVLEGLRGFDPGAAVYIRPMYWGIHGDATGIVPVQEETGFCISLEEIP